MGEDPAKCSRCGSPLDVAAGDAPPLCPNCQTILASPDQTTHPSRTAPLIGRTLGQFKIVELLGRGGMGAVYKAREASLDRFVALKVLPAGLASDSSFVIRFEREARAAAAIHHRNIVQIHAVGQAAGHRYIAMELIDGESLADVIRREGRLPQDRALAVMEEVLAALGAAHDAGIVHRDIKPSNIMFDSRGDVRVTDFGLAKRTEGDVSATQVGDTLGTPLYMAPESASGLPADARSDLYSFGATFYGLLAGRPPFVGRTPAELVIKHATEAPPPVDEVAPDTDPRLCRIIDRLLRKDPAERYPSAQALLGDLETLGDLGTPADAARAEAQKLLADAPTLTMSAGRRLEREAAVKRLEQPPRAGRKRAAIIAATAGAAAVILAIVIIASAIRPKSRETGQLPAQQEAREQNAETVLGRARRAADLGQWLIAIKELDRLKDQYANTRFYAKNGTAVAQLRAKAEEAGKLRKPPEAPPEEIKPPPTEWVSLFDGKTLDGWRIFKQGDFARHGPVDVDEGRIVLGAGGQGTALTWTREFPSVDYEVSLEAMRLGGTQVFAGLVFPVNASRCQFELGRQVVGLSTVDGHGGDHNPTTRRMAFEDGRWYRTRLRVTAAKIEVWIDEEKVVDFPTAGHRLAPWANAESIRPFGVYTWLASGALRNIRLRRLKPEEPPPEPKGEWTSLFDGKTLEGWQRVRVYGPRGGWKRQGGQVRVRDGRIVLEKGNYLTGIAWTGDFPNDDYEVAIDAMRVAGEEDFCDIGFPVAGRQCTLIVGGRKTLTGLTMVDGRDYPQNETRRHMQFRANQWYTVRLRVTKPRIEAWVDREKVVDLPRQGHTFDPQLDLQPQTSFALWSWLTTSALRNIRVRRLEGVEGAPKEPRGLECRLVATLRGHTRPVVSIAFSPDGTRVATGSQDNAVRLWDAADWQCLGTLRGHEGFVESVAFSPDGKRLITSSMDRTVRIWDAATGECLKVLEGHTDAVHGAFFLADGQRAVSAGSDGALRIWDATTGKCLKTFTDPDGRTHVQHMALSADGKRLATGGKDGVLRLWDTETGACLRKIHAGSRELWCTAFSPDGERVATAGNDPAIKVWNTATGQLLTRLGTPRLNRGLAFSPDGKWLAAGDWTGSLQFSDATTYGHLKAVRGHTRTAFRIAFSPDGKRLASASFDHTAKIWALEPQDVVAKPPEPEGDWVSLFDGKTLEGWRVVEEGVFAGHGKVAVDGGRIVLEMGRTRTGIVTTRTVPTVDYEIALDAMRIAGNDDFCGIVFPVGISHCHLSIGGWPGAGPVVALNLVDGREGWRNFTARRMKFARGRWYRVRLRVTDARIEAWIDGEKVIDVETAGHRFAPWPHLAPLKPLGVRSYMSTSALRNIRIRRLKPEEPPPAPKLPEKPGVWAPLFDGKTLAGWRVVTEGQFAGHGRVRVEGGQVILGQGAPRTGMAWTSDFPTLDYELAFEARRDTEREAVCYALFPVGSSHVILNLGGWGRSVVGLSTLDGRDAPDNDAASQRPFETGRWYAVRLRVTEGRIEAWCGDEKIVDLPTEGRRITPQAATEHLMPLGLANWSATTALRNIRMQRLEGKPEEPPAGGEQLKMATVAVSARADWFDTGLYLAKGQRYAISATGPWGHRPQCSHGPQARRAGGDYPLPGARQYALIARVGAEGRPFEIRSPVAIAAAASGRLHLRMNDNIPRYDNWGCKRVTVQGQLVADKAAPLLARFTKVVRELQVDSRRWNVSGIDVRRGDVYLMTATGRWSSGPGRGNFDANGLDQVMGFARTGALTGRIGEHGELFTIGTLHLLEAREPGKLYLAMQDATLEDNDGSLAVTISSAPALDQLRRKPQPQPGLACRPLATLSGHAGLVLAVAFSPDGTRLASGGDDGTVRLWDVTTGKCVSTLRGHRGKVEDVAFSPDGKWLASAGLDGTIRVWDVATGQWLKTLERHQGAVASVAFFPDSKRLASGSDDKTIKILDLATGQPLKTLPDHRGRVNIAISPDGARIASASDAGWVRVWDVAAARVEREFFGQCSKCWSVAFSPDGKRIVTGGYDPVLRVWDAATGKRLASIEAPAGNHQVAFSPDGKWIASGGWFGTVQFWDATTYEHLTTVKAHQGTAFALAFSPDGKRFASGGWQGSAKIWALEPRGAAERRPVER